MPTKDPNYRGFTVEQMLDNEARVEAMKRDIKYYFFDKEAYPWYMSDDSRITDLRERGIWNADDEALARHLLHGERDAMKKAKK